MQSTKRATADAWAFLWAAMLSTELSQLRSRLTVRQGLALCFGALLSATSLAQETVCARVKMQISQELALERQAFSATMSIANTLDTTALTDVGIVVKITDENGVPVAISDDSANVTAKFFVRVSSKQNITDINGNGSVPSKTTSVIDWLIIPAPGAAANAPLGKKYLVGATLTYKFSGETHTLEVSPAVIKVKPLPLLTLDYFLTQDVVADDPMTPQVEPTEPFTLGVRVKNNGIAAAKNLKIDSAQPKIIENEQGLLINFKLTGSYLNDAPTDNTLLLNFGEIAGNSSKTGRWIMETTLAGKFTEFTASFTHADELGGALTSIMQGVNAHFLLRDVRVDLLGRDTVRDFLSKDENTIRVYESEGFDTLVTDLSASATLSTANGNYRLTAPATAGFVYAKLPDPFAGQKVLGVVMRSDGKPMLPENVWLSKTKNAQTKQWEYWVSFFDANSTGIYDLAFQAPPTAAQPPVIQFIPDQVVTEEQALAFLVTASSAAGRPITVTAAPLPSGAAFIAQAPDPAAPTVANSAFNWVPAKGTAGTYLIVYSATDGSLTASQSATITVKSSAPPPGPGTPLIVSPASGAHVASLRPTLTIQTATATNDPTTQVQWEIFADEAMAQRIDGAMTPRGAVVAGQVGPTSWQLGKDLNDNTHYWWHARAFDGSTLYSPWVSGRLFVNLFNNAPGNFNLINPAPGVEVGTLLPTLSWANSLDVDGDLVSYKIQVFRDEAMSDRVILVEAYPADSGASTSLTLAAPLQNHGTYYWMVTASDAIGALTPSDPRSFVVNTGNTPPTSPIVVSPLPGSRSTTLATPLVVQNSVDAEGDLITYVFEIDTVNTFNSGNKRTSGQVIQSAAATTTWVASGLIENNRYYWRVKAQDGRTESVWVSADFMASVVNDPPPMPTVKNPGHGAWVSMLQPTLEANPVLDPEGDAVSYQFEVYRDAGMSNKLTDGTSQDTSWLVSSALSDKTTYWWRLRASDVLGASSAWGPANIMYVSTGPYQNPTIEVISPATPVMPEVVGGGSSAQKLVTIGWVGNDPNIDASVALYYSNANTGYGGNLIIDGLRQPSGSHAGSYVWDVSHLAAGTYYVYAVIYDPKGAGQAYAPGAVVIPPATQSGQIVVATNGALATSESGTKASFKVRLANAPTADVVVPISAEKPKEGIPAPASLTFTPTNWGVDQTVTVTGLDDCTPDGTQQYNMLVGKAVSVDANYIGLAGTPVSVSNADNNDRTATTNNAQIHLCRMTIVSSTPVGSPVQYEYVLTGDLTNNGLGLSGLTAVISSSAISIPVTFVESTMSFGAAATGETIRSVDTVTVRSTYPPSSFGFFMMSGPFRWTVTTQP
jgi:hypothetical protein